VFGILGRIKKDFIKGIFGCLFFIMKKLVNIKDNIKIGSTGSRKYLTGDLFHPPEGEVNGSAIVIIHGGGWREGDKDQLRGYGILLAREGFTCLTAL